MHLAPALPWTSPGIRFSILTLSSMGTGNNLFNVCFFFKVPDYFLDNNGCLENGSGCDNQTKFINIRKAQLFRSKVSLCINTSVILFDAFLVSSWLTGSTRSAIWYSFCPVVFPGSGFKPDVMSVFCVVWCATGNR